MTFFFFLLQLSDPRPDAALLKSTLLSWSKTESEIASLVSSRGSVVLDSNGYVTKLILRSMNLTGEVPSSLGSLSKLDKLYLDRSKLTGEIPSSLGSLSNLEELYLTCSKLTGEVPSSLGNPSSLKELRLHGNKLTGEIPSSLGNLSKLERLYLSRNKLTGEVPSSLGSLSNLKGLTLDFSSGLSGHLPVLPAGCDASTRGTTISSVAVRTKALRPDYCFLDYFLVVVCIILGYVDFVSDILAAVELFAVSRTAVGVLSTSFLVLSTVLGLLNCRTLVDVTVAIFQLGPLVSGIETLMQGRQTQRFMADKKLDCTVRSGSSTTLQFFILLTTLSVISERGYFILLASIALGVVGAACTQASLARKSRRHLFRWRFVLHALYYLSEILLRTTTVCIMFTATKGYALILIAADLCFRIFTVSTQQRNRIDFTLSTLYFGSDNALSSTSGWVRGSFMTALELLVFLIVINTLHTVELDIMREHNSVRDVSIISCCALLVKTGLWRIVERLPEEPPEELKDGQALDGALGILDSL